MHLKPASKQHCGLIDICDYHIHQNRTLFPTIKTNKKQNTPSVGLMDTFVIITPAEVEHEEHGIIQIEIIHTYRAEDVEDLAVEKLNDEWEHESFYSEDYGYLDEHDIGRILRKGEFDIYKLEDDEEVELAPDELQLFYEVLEEEG